METINNQTIEGNKLIAEYSGKVVRYNVIDNSPEDHKSITEIYNNDKGIYVHVPKGSGLPWWKVKHRGEYFQIFTDFTYCKLKESELEIGIINDKNRFQSLSELTYHSSWDWLMPVIKQIIASNALKTIDECSDEEWFQITRITNMYIGVSVEQAYHYVVEYIKWHNSQQH